MEKKLFNDHWLFTKQTNGMTLKEIRNPQIEWKAVEIPHDWLIEDTLNLYESGEGWYQKKFVVEKESGKCYKIAFDGVYMNSTLYVNEQEVGTWRYGYSSFEWDITEYLVSGENNMLLQVRYESPNTRWYSGAGIYRNVWLKVGNACHLNGHGLYITTNGSGGDVTIQAEVTGVASDILGANLESSNIKADVQELFVKTTIMSPSGESICELISNLVSEFDSDLVSDSVPASDPADLGNVLATITQKAHLSAPLLWSLETPNLYQLTAELMHGDIIIDSETTSFGFRTMTFDANEGFFLNGNYMKLKGVCLHHDLGALGAAVNRAALKRQLILMKDMGANAIRTAHNMPAPELMSLCDELGLMVVSEAFDMWESAKTPYDYARFFDACVADDVASWVRRDRNHPSLLMWSIGNEIHDTHASLHGLEIAKRLKAYVLTHDPHQNGYVTIGSNYIAWENAQLVADELKFSGYNYGERLYDAHHEKYPDWIIYGSETASNVRSRGIYHFPADTPILMHDDLQCSSLDNSAVAWGGKSAENTWILDRDRKFCAGQFIWTGFDYIGEPTPYSTKNSYFGIVDTAGIPKDIYYMYQSEWTDYKVKPVIHLLPYWDFNLGQEIDVMVYTNAPSVELFFNGESLGIQHIDHLKGNVLHGSWRVAYAPGVLEAKALDEMGICIASTLTQSFTDPVTIELTPDKTILCADGRDMIFIEVGVLDEAGVPVANARNQIEIEVAGAARLVGLDNGDPTDYDSYKGCVRKLFSGKMTAMLMAKQEAGDITVTARGVGLKTTCIVLHSQCAEKVEGITVISENSKTAMTPIVPIRKIELSYEGTTKLTKEQPVTTVSARLLPSNASFSQIDFKVVNNAGIESNNAQVSYEGTEAMVTAKGDGVFRLRATATNGGDTPQVISELEFSVSGLGDALCNPYTFVSASAYGLSNVPLNIIQDKAIGGFDGRTIIGFKGVHFGTSGSDVLRLSVGNCGGGPVPIEVWEGLADQENSKHLMTLDFQLNGRWDGFEPADFALPHRLKGLKIISFVISDKIIFGGFEFLQANVAYEPHYAGDCLQVYGDDFEIVENRIEGIGNNVTIEFGEMNFGELGATKMVVSGKTPNLNNTIQLRTHDGSQQKTQLVEFARSETYSVQTFEIEALKSQQSIALVFLPGTQFDLEWIRFE